MESNCFNSLESTYPYIPESLKKKSGREGGKRINTLTPLSSFLLMTCCSSPLAMGSQKAHQKLLVAVRGSEISQVLFGLPISPFAASASAKAEPFCRGLL